MITPTYSRELGLLRKYQFIAGVDEVGRGPLAGPVVSAAVILDPLRVGKYRSKTKWWAGIRDSKTVSEEKRQTLSELIKENSLGYALGIATHREIDDLNIHFASLLSMKRAIESLKIFPEIVLIDGKFIIPQGFARGTIAQRAIVDGDAHVLSIAAASLLAKVFRDDLMKNYAKEFPEYGFEKHKGYDTLLHRKAIVSSGVCQIHRMTFPAVLSIISERFESLRIQNGEG